MKFFIHIALDVFGGETLGRAARWLREAAYPDNEQHIYVWGGCGEPPAPDTYWEDKFPAWGERIEAPSPSGTGFETDRRQLAVAATAWLTSKAGIDKFRILTHDLPGQLVGKNMAVEPVLTYSLSLLDPTGSALLLAHLAARAERRRLGSFPFMAHVVAGAGFCSGPFDGPEEQARAAGARALLDVEALFKQYPAADVAAPVYVAGEQRFDNSDPDRAAQCALAAMTLVALTRGGDGAGDNPFEFEIDAAGNARRGLADYHPETPLSAVGGFLAWCPASRLARLLAARLAARVFESLAQQQGCHNFEQTSKLVLPVLLAGLLDGVERETVVRVWERAVDQDKIPWDPAATPAPSGCFDLERVRAIYGTVFKEKDWVRVMRVYGGETLREIPLDAWENRLDELQELIENGVIPRRKQRIALITRRALSAFLDSVQEGISGIFGGAFEAPVEAQPHRAAQAFLGRLRSSLLAKGESVESEGAVHKAQGRNPGELRKSAVKLREDLEKAIEAVPSPLTVLLRLVPVFTLCVAFFVLLPVDLKWINPPAFRLATGAAIGLAAALGIYIRKIERVRQQLLGGASMWLQRYQAAIEAEDELLREATYRDLLDGMMKCLEWLFDGDEDEPPLPRIHEPQTKKRPPPRTEDPDILRPQEPLSRFHQYLNAAGSAFRGLETQFLHQFQSSRLEAALPNLTIRNEAVLKAEYRAITDAQPDETETAAAVRLLGEMKQWMYRRSNRPWVLPFSSSPGELTVWRRSFLLPDGRCLLEPEARAGSSAFRFLETLSGYLRERSPHRFDLSWRLGEYVTASGTAATLTDLYRDYTGRAVLPVAVANLTPFIHVSAADETDVLAINLRRRNALGHGRLSIYMQCSAPVSASQVIFHPSERDPITPMGRAWKAHLAKPFPGEVFQPVERLMGEASR